jgi:hypothetical protein
MYEAIFEKNKFFCYFCMEYHCKDCMYKNDLQDFSESPNDILKE